MKTKELEITFKKDVLFEKILPLLFCEMTKIFCEPVQGSFLHVNISSKRIVTIIRYAYINNYAVGRIFKLNFTEFKRFKNNLDHVDAFSNIYKLIIYENSLVHQRGSFHTGLNGRCSDSRVFICHKEALLWAISDCNIIMGNYFSTDKPWTKANRANTCEILYGNYRNVKPLENKFHNLADFLHNNEIIELNRKTNSWLSSLKRKGRRLLKHSMVIDPEQYIL